MAQRGWGVVVRHLGVLLTSGTASGLSDGQLIERFADQRFAEVAFEALVARHGGMVRNVCLQVLRHEHDADDAFQAVFLVLARRAGSIRDPQLLAPWLHGVALRTARLARKRRRKSFQSTETAYFEPPEQEIVRREEAELLHVEIARLPENQRRAVVLCHLNGLTHEEAASRLGVPSGTVGVRLMRAREQLRLRLTHRGIAPSIPLLWPPVQATTVRASVAIFYLRGAAAGKIPAAVASLAEGVLHTVIPLKFLFVPLALGLALVGTWSPANDPVPIPLQAVVPPTPQAAQRPAAGRPEVFFVMDRGTALSLGPDGEEIGRLDSIPYSPMAISPDGERFAFCRVQHEGGPIDMVIQSLSRPEDRATVPNVGGSFPPLWSSDSKRILLGEEKRNAEGVERSAYRVYDLGTKDLTTLKLTTSYRVSDWSADGKRILATPSDKLRIAWVALDGGEPEFITSEQEVAFGAKLSPDGRRILCFLGPKADPGTRLETRLSVIDLETKKRTIVDEPGETAGYCWSPDGSRVAYTWQRPIRMPANFTNRETFLITCNRDGGGRKSVTSRKYEVRRNSLEHFSKVYFFDVFDWK